MFTFCLKLLFTYFDGNLYMYPLPASVHTKILSTERKSPDIHLSPLGAMYEHKTLKSPTKISNCNIKKHLCNFSKYTCIIDLPIFCTNN